ncbi:MAG: hypothetical protein IRZ05_10665 [Micromonosporaceae bacterium]|jgi:hypothetical protein|nr:hypothetical protein [Micromonosporaceae bacterium]
MLRATAALAAAPLAGCGLFDREDPERDDPLDPLLAATVRLAAEYDAVIAAQPALAERLTPLRDAHRAHAKALAQLIGRPASSLSASPVPSSPPGDPSAALAHLQAAEKAGQDQAAAACLAAPADRTALLGSITAARATHQEVLR